jgi:hypothetical protein
MSPTSYCYSNPHQQQLPAGTSVRAVTCGGDVIPMCIERLKPHLQIKDANVFAYCQPDLRRPLLSFKTLNDFGALERTFCVDLKFCHTRKSS